jgi:hypothetical protein
VLSPPAPHILRRLMQFRLLLLLCLGYSYRMRCAPQPAVMFAINITVPVGISESRWVVLDVTIEI